jgi:hypothetical protein
MKKLTKKLITMCAAVMLTGTMAISANAVTTDNSATLINSSNAYSTVLAQYNHSNSTAYARNYTVSKTSFTTLLSQTEIRPINAEGTLLISTTPRYNGSSGVEAISKITTTKYDYSKVRGYYKTSMTDTDDETIESRTIHVLFK